MGIKTLNKKIKLARIGKIRLAPRWADSKKFGQKRARTRRIRSEKKRWRRTKLRV